ncbi:MAG: dTDP-glucose 4,6-dehydratase [Proteobacteria bacterium]|nr:dTDP-glucose 4,6-dehydratase [Pseudomonadota bacterium]
MKKTILITGGCGFIGSNFIRILIKNPEVSIINLDALTYAGNPDSLFEAKDHPNYTFIHGNITDRRILEQIYDSYTPHAVINFAAESHVDRSIRGPEVFIETNIIGTFKLLEATRNYWDNLNETAQSEFRFLHISTDEVYGSLDNNAPSFSEKTPYSPRSPYSASKAASDHLVKAWHETYGLPTLITNCSNNYGPAQFPEKLIPLIILNALEGNPLPIYGDGQAIRDWLFVEEHCEAILSVLERGRLGETYCIGGKSERTNLQVVKTICKLLDTLKPRSDRKSYEDQITFVSERPGHDHRYAIDTTKIESELGWKPSLSFEDGLQKTLNWYLANPAWLDGIKNKLSQNMRVA